MRQEEILKNKYGTDPGFRVPDGYFEDLNARIMAGLPSYPEMSDNVSLTKWQRVKPYVYLAAMFAGIWMMMKVFHTVSTADKLTLDNPPEAIVQLMDGDGFDMFEPDMTGSELELEEEVSASYESIDEFQEDFGYSLSPEYASMKVSPSTDIARHV